jgi:hypothetical protein
VIQVSRWLLLGHRWLGVILGTFFALWFASGAVMMYVPFPSLAGNAKLAGMPAVDGSRHDIAPPRIAPAAGSAELDRLRVIDVAGRPAYVLHRAGQPLTVIDAVDGRLLPPIEVNEARRMASRYVGRAIAAVDGPLIDDKWVVSNEFDAHRPFFRVRFADDDGSVVYVSARTGEVVQQTTRRQRAWNYAGAVVHWIYPTILRRHWVAWDQVVWWLSLAGVVVAASGLWLGCTRIVGRQRSGDWRWSPFRGWLRWHHVLGLCAGTLALTWIVSGWLSMDHGRLFSLPDPTAERAARFRGVPIAEAAVGIDESIWARVGPYREAELVTVAGVPWLVTRNPGSTRSFRADQTEMLGLSSVPLEFIEAAVRGAWSPANIASVERPGDDDAYARLRAGSLPMTTLRFKLDDAEATWVHVDAATGAIVSVMDRSRRWYRWLYNGLHSFDVPAVTRHRPLWDILMLSALALGLAFISTAVVIGWKRILKTL